MLWDIFCKVIDNHGDIGVCWRLSLQLAARGHRVRLWVDDDSALRWMAPQGNPRVQVLPWAFQAQPQQCGDVVIEAFGCELEQNFQAAIAVKTRAQGRQPPWFNLEYLSAEPFTEHSHGLPSPILAGAAAGLVKRFFYPGFTAGTGGLLREHDLVTRQANFDRAGWLRDRGIDPLSEHLVSLFCYEPPALDQLLGNWARDREHTRLLVTAGRAEAAVRAATLRKDAAEPAWNQASRLSICYLPALSQLDFDHLLWACDINFVRGEDSLTRALWAGKPLAWQIYPQHDNAHHAKLGAFLDWLKAPAELRDFHSAWNGLIPNLPPADFAAWTSCMQAARGELLAQEDLLTRLMRLVSIDGWPAP